MQSSPSLSAPPSPLSQPRVQLPPARVALLLPALSLAKRELVRFLRQRHRIVGALATPIVFWLVIGAGMGKSFNANGPGATPASPAPGSSLLYFYPGTVVMILLFTAIFSTISIIEDRREGFLQSVLVAPISPMVIVLGKVLGGTALAFGQGLIFLALAPLLGVHFTAATLLAAMAYMFLMGFALTGLGFCIAWRMSSTQGFHAIMNLFLMPMWFASGALFPAANAWAGMKWAIRLNPLSYGLAGLRRAMTGAESIDLWCGPAVWAGVSVAFAAVMFLLASATATRRISDDMQ